MDAHTLSAAQGTPAVVSNEDIHPSQELLRQLSGEFKGQSLEAIEQQCRQVPPQDSAQEAIALGLRLLFLKEMTKHGEWMITLDRVGIGHSMAYKTMALAIRIAKLPEAARLIEAANSKSKLFELLVLDDDELVDLNQGKAVRGVSLTTLPQTSVMVLRSMLKPAALTASPISPSADPIMGASLIKCADIGAFEPHAAQTPPASPLRPRKPVWGALPAMSDGVANIAQQDGEAQTDQAPLPSIYALRPVEFNGKQISLVHHDSQVWMIADDVAAVLGNTPEEVGAIEAFIDQSFKEVRPALAAMDVRLASTTTVLRLLNRNALMMLDIKLDTPATKALYDWFEGNAVQMAEPVRLAYPVEPEPVLNPGELLKQIDDQHYRADRMVSKVIAQLQGIVELTLRQDEGRVHIGELVEVALDIVSGWNDLFHDMDCTMSKFEKSVEAAA